MAPSSTVNSRKDLPPIQHTKSQEVMSSSNKDGQSSLDTNKDCDGEVVIKKRKKLLKVTFCTRTSRKKLKSSFSAKHKKALGIYNKLREGIPTFEEDMRVISKDTNYLDQLCKTMITAAGTARSNDISSLKKDVLTYAALCLPEGRLDPPINPNDSKKATRGFKHPQLGTLLVPVASFEQYKTDPEYCRKLSLNKVAIKAKAMPHLVYPFGKYDPEHILEGMFMAPALVAVYQHIFMSPSSALKTPGATRTGIGKARKHHMKSVTIASIAYACTHYRYGISRSMDWRQNNMYFNYKEFYLEVVKMLEWARENDPEWWKDFITWWNAQVFPTEEDSLTESSSSDKEVTMSTFKKLKAQVKASRVEKASLVNDTGSVPPPPPFQYRQEELSPSPSPRRSLSPPQISSIPQGVGIHGRQHPHQYAAGQIDSNIDPHLQMPASHVANGQPYLGSSFRPVGIPQAPYYNMACLDPIASASTPSPVQSRGHPTPRALGSMEFAQHVNHSPEWQLVNTHHVKPYMPSRPRMKASRMPAGQDIESRHPSVGPPMNIFPDMANW
ncbi:hypothetical protein JR316_0006731 [Psilocybe cubensis]|uniref:Uncharacterized protein n=2 Tax=Psilocybe cubensis TaxID=181762 RepID=A0A8H8CEE0_PSICU|nr:hypothetical protein JR316_0006731 [Psilocybe cubensis]KAH9480134.1 hypothetical protein JR316_0006731 [Psilocybe cubensis]